LVATKDSYTRAKRLFPELKLPKENFQCFYKGIYSKTDIDVLNREFLRLTSPLQKETYLPPGATGEAYTAHGISSVPAPQAPIMTTRTPMQNDEDLQAKKRRDINSVMSDNLNNFPPLETLKLSSTETPDDDFDIELESSFDILFPQFFKDDYRFDVNRAMQTIAKVSKLPVVETPQFEDRAFLTSFLSETRACLTSFESETPGNLIERGLQIPVTMTSEERKQFTTVEDLSESGVILHPEAREASQDPMTLDLQDAPKMDEPLISHERSTQPGSSKEMHTDFPPMTFLHEEPTNIDIQKTIEEQE
jgi:hypothetical protein